MAATMHAYVESGIIKERRVLDLALVPLHKQPPWKPVVKNGDDQFDSSIQVKEGPVTTIEATQVTDTWTIRAKTAAELDSDKDNQVNAFNSVAFKIAFNHENRIRALEAKPAITAAQFKAAIKALL